MCEAGVRCSAHVILKSAVVHLHTHRRQKYPHQDASPPHKGSAFVVDILGYHVIAPYKWKNQQKSPFFPGNHLLIQSHQPHLLVHRLCRAAQCQICWSSRSIWTTLTDVGSGFWVLLHGARSWIWWSSWFASNSGYSVFWWLSRRAEKLLCWKILPLTSCSGNKCTSSLKNTGTVGDMYRLMRFFACVFKFVCPRLWHMKKQDQQKETAASWNSISHFLHHWSLPFFPHPWLLVPGEVEHNKNETTPLDEAQPHSYAGILNFYIEQVRSFEATNHCLQLTYLLSLLHVSTDPA